MSEPVYSFGAWVRLRRHALLLNREQLAQRVGCAEVTIRKIESDERRPSAQVAELLARHLAVPAEQHEQFIRVARGLEMVERLPPAAGSTLVDTLTSDAPSATFRPATNLPSAPNALIGRDDDLVAIDGMLVSGARLMTLTGAGGSGKTRLALELGRKIQERYGDGVWFVDVSPITDGSQIAATIAQALGINQAPGQSIRANLVAWLHNKHLLLVLDNCEQVVAGAAELVTELLHETRALAILATSRVPLRISAEQEYPLEPLTVPDTHALPAVEQLAHYDAVALFTARARAIVPAFVITEANAAAVAQICALLDGLPLALELAAARIRVFTPEQLVSRLASSRLQMLSGGRRDAPQRQQTIRSTIAWSEQLLAGDEQTLFARLGVFVGGWTFHAAETICGGDIDVVAALETLIEHSLVRVSANTNEPRYTMLETVREYALERLQARGEHERLQRWHAEYYAALVATAEPHIRSAAQLDWLARMAAEWDNIRHALSWALEQGHDVPLGMQMIADQWFGWILEGRYTEAPHWLNGQWADSAELPPEVRASLLLAREFYDEWSIGLRFVRNHLNDQGLELVRAAGNSWLLALSLADQAVHKHDFVGEQAIAYGQEARALAETLDDPWLLAYATLGVGASAFYSAHDPETALATIDRAETIASQVGERFLLCMIYWTRALILCTVGAYTEARDVFLKQAATGEGLRNYLVGGYGVWGASWACDNLGDFATAHQFQQRRLDIERTAGNAHGEMDSLGAVGYSHWRMGRYLEAQACLEQSILVAEAHSWFDTMVEASLQIAIMLLEQGKYKQAEQRISSIQARLPHIYSSTKAPYFVARLLGEYSLYRGDLARADEYFTSARTQFGGIDKTLPADLSVGLGMLARRQGHAGIAQALINPYAARRGYMGSMQVARLAQIEAAIIALDAGDSQAPARFQQAFITWKPTRARREIVRLLEGCANLMAASEAPQVAAGIWGAAATLREKIGSMIWPVDRPDFDRRIAAARAALGDAAFEAAWQAGRLLTWEQAADEALAWLDNVPTQEAAR